MKRTHITIGIILTLILLASHLSLISDYGLTWDFHFHFFSGAHFFGLKWQEVEPRPLPYVEPDPRNTVRLPYGPFVQIIPFASWLLFYKNLQILPYDVAYNLPIVLAGVLGIGALYFFLSEAINWKTGLVAGLFLALTPRYFADLHNDMKDAPMAAVFALNMWMIWRLWRYKRIKDLLLAALAFALAFNTKINSIFIPAIFGAWLFAISIKGLVLRGKEKSFFIGHWKLVIGYFLLAPLGAFLLWWFFWEDPVGQLKLAVSTFGGGADNIEVLLNGNWYCAGSTVPWYYPYWYLAITTPLPILVLFFIGLIRLISPIGLIKKPINSLLLLWLFLPLTRYLLPKIAVIDGVRHFEEVLYPIAAIAAVGFIQVMKIIFNIPYASERIRFSIIILLSSFIIYHLSFIIISYHPFQVAYYNEFVASNATGTPRHTWLSRVTRFDGAVGGAHGAFGKYDLDYWGSSQKKAIEWINVHAEKNASVTIVMAGNVAGLYLRPDLLTNLNSVSYDTVDYVVILNRQSFFYRFYAYEYLLTHKPIHAINVDGVPLVWIFDNRLPKTPRQTPWWKGEDPCIRKYW